MGVQIQETQNEEKQAWGSIQKRSVICRRSIFIFSTFSLEHIHVLRNHKRGGGSENGNFYLRSVLKVITKGLRGQNTPKILKICLRNIWMVPYAFINKSFFILSINHQFYRVSFYIMIRQNKRHSVNSYVLKSWIGQKLRRAKTSWRHHVF